MKKIMSKFKKALVLVLSVAMVCNTVDMSMLNVYAESATVMEQGNDAVGDATVSNNDSSTISENHSNTVSAGNSEEVYQQSGVLELDEYKGAFMLPSVETSAVSMSLFSLRTGVVDKISGTAVNWIDRLDLSGDEYKFARDLYNNLVEWTDNDGVEDLLIEDSYYASSELVKEVVSVTLTGADLDETVQNVYEQLTLHIPYVRAVYDAFDRDYPEVFWLSGEDACSFSDLSYTSMGELWQCTASLNIVLKGTVNISETEAIPFDMRQSAYQSQTAIENAIASRDAAVAAIITDEIKEQSAKEQIDYFNDTLTKMNQYNTIVGNSVSGQVPEEAWECISALTGKAGTEGPVCEGYARAFKVLCDQAGIPCVLVDGNAVAGDVSGPHMWNYVQVDGDWYAMDVTWNDPIISENSGALSGGECVKWSLVGSDTVVNDMKFIESHPVSNTASSNGVVFDNGPVLSAEKYTNYVASVMTDSGTELMYEDIKKAFDVANADGMGATLKLLKSVKLIDGYTITGEFTLDLNGCTLDLGNYTMVVSEGATLTISDSSVSGASNGTGKLTSCVQGRGVIDNRGTLKVLSGTIEATEATEATEYTDNYAIMNQNIMEMSGGLLTTNAWHGSGIYNTDSGQVTVTGGVVQGSTHAESKSISASGIENWGDLTIAGTPGIYGGGDAAGIRHSNGSFMLSGAPVVQGSTTMGDICLESGMVITVAGALTGSDSYSVYSYDTGLGVFAVSGTGYTMSDSEQARFTSAMGFDISRNGEGKLVFAHVHEDMSYDKVWDIYSGDVATGNYVLGYDVEGASAVNITGDVKLCLNGYTLDTGGGCLNIEAGASLSVCDCSAEGTGTISGDGSSTIMNHGMFTLESGNIVNEEDNGTVLYNEAGTATVCLYGGSIQATGEYGVGVFNAGTFRLSGEPVIVATKADLSIDSAASIWIDDALTGKESYTLDYDTNAEGYWGFFADALDASYVTNAKEKFIPIQEGVEVLVNGTSLSLDYQMGDIPISITWEDEDNIYNTRPATMEVEIYANDEYVETVYVTEEDSWEYTLEDMYLYDVNGAITYDVTLNDPSGAYSGTPGASEDGFVIIASLKHVHELYLSQSSNGVADTQYVEILCEGSDSEDCDWRADYWVTINGPTYLAYDGSAKTASTVDLITGCTDLATVSDIVYYVKNGNTWTAVTEAVDAGTYKAEVTVTIGSDTLTAWVAFEIIPLDGASYVEVVPYDGDYDPFAENGVEAVWVGILHPEMDATIEYSTDGGTNWSTTVPVMSSVGSLEVMVRVTAPNYNEYTETVTAVMTPFDLSNCNVELEQDSYYYTGQQIKPVVTGITDSLGRKLPLTGTDYEVTYGDNHSVESPGYVYVEATNPNYTGTAQREFGINYYDGLIEVLYNGAENTYEYYNADVVISAEGYTVSKTIDGTYTDTVMLSGDGMAVEMSVYFKQDGTGYITPATLVSAKIDKSAPSFDKEGMGIQIGENYWKTLATAITYDTYFNEAQYGFINVSDLGSGLYIEGIYYYIDKSGSAIAKTAEELDACNFVSVADNVQDDDLNAGTGGDFYIDEDGKYVVYAYVVDRAGNKSVYICSGGIVLDTKAPVVEASVPSEVEGTLTDTGMTFTIESDEDAIAVLEIQQVADAATGGITVDSEMTENGFVYLEGLDSDTQIEMGSSEGAKYFYKVELSPGEEKEFTLSELSPNETYTYVIWVFDKAHNLKVIGEELSEEEIRTISVTTLKTIPTFDSDPTITGTYGDELSRMTLSQPASTNGIPGTWSIVYAGAGQRHDIPAVNGTTAYTVRFTPEDTDTYETVTVQVVPTVAKMPLTVEVDNQFRVYGEENPELTYTITEGSIVDANYAGRPRLSIALSTTATSSSDVGVYDITGTVTNDVNYDVTVQKGTLTIEKADTVITVEAGKDAYSKTFGDDSFVLGGISTNSDGKLSYSVANSDVVSVDANGKVTINGAGSAVITVSVAATNNYTATEAVEITVNVAKADAAGVNLSKNYLYLRDAQESIDLTGYVPADAGAVAYQVGAVSGACEFAVAPVVSNGKLSYTVKAGDLGHSASFAVTVSSDNYETFDIQVTVNLVDQTPVVEREGSEVSLKNNTLTYGEALSKLEFNEAVFVAEGTGEVVTGKLTWETPELTPNVATTKATWVFTPDSDEYMEATGEVAIIVKKAVQPAFNIVALGDVEYVPGKVLTVTTTGGVAGGKVTVSVPANNGVVEMNADGTVKVLGAGTVTLTAVKVDAAGNYEDATATYELTVAPVALKAEQVAWATGFNGKKTYNGQAQEADVTVTVAGMPLVEGTDYIVAYANNTNAYTVAESEVGFDADKAPAVVVTGKGNYAGTVKKYFVIHKADAVLTVEAGKDAYSKTFGDDAFVLSGISTNSDGKLSYAVANDDVISVDANGKVTINGAGSAVITVSVAATNNYTAAEAVEITVDVAKATVTDKAVSKSYLYLKESQENIDLTGYVPTDAGAVTYQVGAVSGACEFAVAPVVANGKLSYTVKAGDLGDSASFAVTVSSDNYEAFDIQVTVTLVNQIPVEAKKVSLKNKLTYGDALSKLEFAETVFVAEGTDEVVNGTIAWETPDYQPDVATTKATWVFTPDDALYMTATGEVAIVVEKAEYPEMTIVMVKPTVYGESGYLAVEGALGTSEVTLTVPENNGVVKEITAASGNFEIVAENAGKVTVTATAKDNTGNYKDGTATYELTVKPAEIKQVWLDWEEGFDGVATYTGDALVPNVVVQNGAVTLIQGQDYTVEYAYNEFAYTLKEGDEGFDVSKAPKAVVIGKGNYEGEAMLCFVINKAENAPNMPKESRTVANSVATAGQVSLPVDWVWQNTDQALADGTVTVAIAVYNGADKGNYVNEAVAVSITRLEAGLPFTTEINGEDVEIIKNGWEHVSGDLVEAEEGDVIVVDMNGATVLPGNVIEQIKGKDITVVLEMDEAVTWHINGETIIAEEVPDVDMSVGLNTANIPADVINKITGEIYTMQISLAHNGEFGYTAILMLDLKAENAGYYAQLFHYEETEKLLKFIQQDMINENGFAELPFAHASEYTIVIDEEEYKAPGTDSGNGGNGGTTTPVVPEPTPTPTPTPGSTSAPESTLAPVGKHEATSPLTGDNTVDWVALMAVVSLAVAMGTRYRRRKGRIK